MPDGRWAGCRPDGVTVTGVTHDSRAVQPGDLYAALPGARTHGAAFAGPAVAAGAVALLTDPDGERPAVDTGLPVLVVADPRVVLGPVSVWVYGAPANGMTVLGVTGTNGKTTTSYLIDAGLRAGGHVTGLLGTVETRIGDAVVPSGRTTPEAPDLQALLAVMNEAGVSAVTMEVSSHALALHRVDGTRFAAAVFTNLSQDHLDFHADLADYFSAKAALFTPAYAGMAVINTDDEHGSRLRRLTSLPTATFSAQGDPRADWRARDLEMTRAGSTFTVHGPDGQDARARVQLPGSFNVANALAAIVALVVTGTSLPTAVDGVGRLAGVPGRLERVDEGQPFLAVVDYAHTPDAVTTLLAAVRPITQGRLLVVLGCGGDRDRGKRPLMGQAAARGADIAILTNDNPRGEDPAAILAAVEAGARAARGAEIVVEPDRGAAIALAVARASAGDTVVVAGKGHETGQEQSGAVRPFDDRVVLRQALRAVGA